MGTSSEYFCHQTTFQICYLMVGKKLLTEKRDKERCTIFVVMGAVTDYRGNTVRLVLFPKEPYLPKSPSYSRRQGPSTVPVRASQRQNRS